jgi:hypothetical protein
MMDARFRGDDGNHVQFLLSAFCFLLSRETIQPQYGAQ